MKSFRRSDRLAGIANKRRQPASIEAKFRAFITSLVTAGATEERALSQAKRVGIVPSGEGTDHE